MADPVIRDLLPQFVRTYRNLNAFWPNIKHEAGTYRATCAQTPSDSLP